MLFIFSFAGTQICASSGGPNCKCWCSKSPRLVLKIASAGAQICASSGGPNCKCWCSKSPRLVLKIASAGAQNRLRWCSKSPRLVLKIASAGAQICASSGAFFSCTLRPNHIWIFCPLCALLSKLCHFFHGLRFWVAKSLCCLVNICKLVIAFVTVVQKL